MELVDRSRLWPPHSKALSGNQKVTVLAVRTISEHCSRNALLFALFLRFFAVEHVPDHLRRVAGFGDVRSPQLGIMGNSNKIIANGLNVSETTIKGHMKNILSKLGANDRTHAVIIAMKRGFIDG